MNFFIRKRLVFQPIWLTIIFFITKLFMEVDSWPNCGFIWRIFQISNLFPNLIIFWTRQNSYTEVVREVVRKVKYIKQRFSRIVNIF